MSDVNDSDAPVLQITSTLSICSFLDLSFGKLLQRYRSCAFVCVTADDHPRHRRRTVISGQHIRHLHRLFAFLTVKVNLLHTGFSPPIQNSDQKLEKERESHLYKLLRKVD